MWLIDLNKFSNVSILPMLMNRSTYKEGVAFYYVVEKKNMQAVTTTPHIRTIHLYILVPETKCQARPASLNHCLWCVSCLAGTFYLHYQFQLAVTPNCWQ